MVEGTTLCNKLWTYREVRRLADLSVEEMQYFEETMARLAAAEYCEFKPVSGQMFLVVLNVHTQIYLKKKKAH